MAGAETLLQGVLSRLHTLIRLEHTGGMAAEDVAALRIAATEAALWYPDAKVSVEQCVGSCAARVRV